MKILITGTNGFIGHNLKDYFSTNYNDLHCPKRADLDLLDASAVFEYLTKNKFDVVIHCGVTLSSVEQNLKMYFHLERCSNTYGKMISVGSGSEYDPKHYTPKMKENYFGLHIPDDIYGFSKYVIAKNIEEDRKNIYNMRVFGIYGKYEDYNRRFISNNICRVLAGGNISMNRNMKFDYLYVDDLSKIIDIFLKSEPKLKSYNICTGKPIDFQKIAKIIKEVHGNHCEIEVKQKGANPEYSGDNSLFLEEFGNYNFLDPTIAISELYDWYKNTSNISFDDINFN
jgi:GDP-L-fucose synthase